MKSESQGLLVVISQGQSRSPEKRGLEQAIAAAASNLPNSLVLVAPHLYDLTSHSSSYDKMRTWQGPIFIASWLFDRATHWVLDRMDIRGTVGEAELRNLDVALDEEEESAEDEKASERMAAVHQRPERRIYSVDLRSADNADDFLSEITRILEIEGLGTAGKLHPLTLERFLNPTNSTALSADGSGMLASNLSAQAPQEPMYSLEPLRVEEPTGRRWYPVIDYSRCTNCMECIDFCLFGVYGVDRGETILVEQPDNCRKGCPACSRVCPENAIIFPQHKSPAIAGAPVESGASFKIDLSKLFGAPDRNEDAATAAARERDEQLILAGRAAVGQQPTTAESGFPSKESPLASASPLATADAQSRKDAPKDKLDSLLDELDTLDL